MNSKARDQAKRTAKAKQEYQANLVTLEVWQCCLNCINFDAGKEICEVFKQRPPAKIITTSCEEYENDIPF